MGTRSRKLANVLETAVHDVTKRFGTLVRHVEWSTDHSQVRLEGLGV
jgi:hypothetical protein